MSTTVLARGLSVGWGSHRVVDGIDLSLGEGRTLALVGTNGSGKSTILRTLAGLLPPMAGELQVCGGPPGTQPRRVAYLGQFHPQGFMLPLRARDVVAMGVFPDRGLVGRLRSSDHRRVGEAMDRLQISHLARRPLRDLSGGQQQRVYIAQALAWNADLLLLDEPGAGLDVSALELLSGVVADERARGASVAVATHDIRDAQASDHVMLLAGRVVASGAPDVVLTTEYLSETFGLVSVDGPDGLALPVEHEHCDHAHPVAVPRRYPASGGTT